GHGRHALTRSTWEARRPPSPRLGDGAAKPRRPSSLVNDGRYRMRYTRISADCHIDFPWIPGDLFTAHASAAMKERMPYVVDGADGPYWTTRAGASLGLIGGTGSSGQKYVPGTNKRLDVMETTGFFSDGQRGIRRPTTPELRMKDMDRDGVQAEVIFG